MDVAPAGRTVRLPISVLYGQLARNSLGLSGDARSYSGVSQAMETALAWAIGGGRTSRRRMRFGGLGHDDRILDIMDAFVTRCGGAIAEVKILALDRSSE